MNADLAIDPEVPRRRGRPVDRSNKGKLRRLEVWLHVQTILGLYAKTYGRKISIAAIVRWIENEGGIVSAIGGNVDAIVRAMAEERGHRPLHATRRNRKRKTDRNVAIVDDRKGSIFVKDVMRHKDSLRVRYYEAENLLKNDLPLRSFYNTLLAERLNQPHPHRTAGRRLVPPPQ